MATIFTALQDVQARIDTACTAVGRNPAEVKLLAVSKTFPASDIHALYQFGQRAFGENYVQELVNKCQILAEYNDIEWHFIGPLQSNKTRLVAENAAWVHTIERLKIAERLSAQRPPHLPPLNICLQVNVSGETSKSGLVADQVIALAEQVVKLPQLCLRGLMCIPESSHDSTLLAQQFLVLVQLKEQLQARGLTLDTLSMGMSNDLESAVAAGSTLLRVGSAIFGQRHYSS